MFAARLCVLGSAGVPVRPPDGSRTAKAPL